MAWLLETHSSDRVGSPSVVEFQQAPQVFQQRRIGLGQRRASAARAPNLRPRRIERSQILQSAIDRAASHSRRPRHHADAAVSSRARFRRGEQSPSPLVQAGAHRLKSIPNRCFVNHPDVIAIRIETGNPKPPSKPGSRKPIDSIVSRRRLSRPRIRGLRAQSQDERLDRLSRVAIERDPGPSRGGEPIAPGPSEGDAKHPAQFQRQEANYAKASAGKLSGFPVFPVTLALFSLFRPLLAAIPELPVIARIARLRHVG